MAAGHHHSASSTQDSITHDVSTQNGLTPEALQAWLKPLQQALQLEAERGFGDLKGRQERFSGFVARTLAEPLAGITEPQRQGLGDLARGLASYGELSLARRQNLVRQCRERLHQLRQAHQQTHRQQAPAHPLAQQLHIQGVGEIAEPLAKRPLKAIEPEQQGHRVPWEVGLIPGR